MSFLQTLIHLAGGGHPQQSHPQMQVATPAVGYNQRPMQVGQAHPQMLGNNTPQAAQYAANPMMTGVDPANFGYVADYRLGGQVPASMLNSMVNLGATQTEGGDYPIQGNSMGLQAPYSEGGDYPMQGNSMGLQSNPRYNTQRSGYTWYQ